VASFSYDNLLYNIKSYPKLEDRAKIYWLLFEVLKSYLSTTPWVPEG